MMLKMRYMMLRLTCSTIRSELAPPEHYAIIQDLKQIEYRHGMLEKGMKAESLPIQVWSDARIPAEVRKAVDEKDLLHLGGIYGHKGGGDPVEYDYLKLVLTDDMVKSRFSTEGSRCLRRTMKGSGASTGSCASWMGNKVKRTMNSLRHPAPVGIIGKSNSAPLPPRQERPVL